MQRAFGTRDADGASLGARRLLQEVRREVGLDVRVRDGGTAEIQRKQVGKYPKANSKLKVTRNSENVR